MTDNDIIKALECCSAGAESDCKDCPFGNLGLCNQDLYALEKHALDLIKRQQTEIDYWKRQVFDGCMERGRIDIEARAKAIKEFAERLGEGRLSNDPVVIAAKCLVKEIME